MEGVDYAFGIVPFTSAGIGAPHIRERAYWVAHANSGRFDRRTEAGRQEAWAGTGVAIRNGVNGMAYTISQQREELLPGLVKGNGAEGSGASAELAGLRGFDGMGNTNLEGLERLIGNDSATGWEGTAGSVTSAGLHSRPLEVNGFWRDADWLFCRDGQWRPVESGTFPLVARFAQSLGHGKSSLRAMAGRNRTGRLKGYGNAINAQAASAFIGAYM
jgi:DNA (cytosine-5)-methyltransferase 1